MEQLKQSATAALTQNMDLKKDESILIISDKPLRKIGLAFYEAATEITNNAFLLEITPRSNNGEEPPAEVAEFMKKFDVLILPTSKSLSHTAARRAACEAGVRCATLPGITEDTMTRTLQTDYTHIAKLSDKLADYLTKSKTAVLTTKLGTNLTIPLGERAGHSDSGLVHEKGLFSNLPAGEAYMAPIENGSNGILFIDGTMAGVGVLSSPIKITIEDGYAVKIEGGEEADRLNSLLDKYGKEARNVAELGLGTNDKCKLIGSVLEDEKVLGTVHIALGDNKSMGGEISVPSHLDGIINEPTLKLDNVTIIENGLILV